MDLDPNQENGLDWLMAIHRERGGDAAVVPVLDVASKAAWDLCVVRRTRVASSCASRLLHESAGRHKLGHRARSSGPASARSNRPELIARAERRCALRRLPPSHGPGIDLAIERATGVGDPRR
jgi:hypothetical protein